MLNLHKNVYVISIVMSLSFTLVSMMVLVTGLLGSRIAPSAELATLPAAMLIVGTASATIPAAMLMQHFGRKFGMMLGLSSALLGMALCYHAAMTSNFWLFVCGSVCIGFNAAFTQQGRFIILENSDNDSQQADGLTLALLANLAAAIIGPWMGIAGRELILSPSGFAGCFVLGAGLLLTAMLVLSLFKNKPIETQDHSIAGRSLWTIAKQPIFILAAGSAAVGYGVMSLVMTATPISMHEISGHSLNHTTIVIQSHIIAMFLPSLLSGYLLKKGLRSSMLLCGLGLYTLVVAVGFLGIEVLHYWWALVLLGIGWNFLFLTSTSLLPLAYQGQERFKTQALNDFIIFSVQAVSAFAAGWLLFNLGWNSLLTIALCTSVVWFATVAMLRKRVAFF